MPVSITLEVGLSPNKGAHCFGGTGMISYFSKHRTDSIYLPDKHENSEPGAGLGSLVSHPCQVLYVTCSQVSGSGSGALSPQFTAP